MTNRFARSIHPVSYSPQQSGNIKRCLQAYLFRQLRHPSGWIGRLILKQLNQDNATMNQVILQQLNPQSDQRILEIGFGGGDLIDRLLKTDISITICGIDPSSTVIAVAQKRFKEVIAAQRLTLEQATAEHLPLQEQTFDAIATVNTLYFWDDAPAVIQECCRVLTLGGVLAIAYNTRDFLETQQATQFGFRGYNVDQIEHYLHIAGYSDIQTISDECPSNGKFYCTSGTRPT